MREGRNSQHEQLEIIREEVAKADRIITELMGYAQLAEGRVENSSVTEELDRAITEVFPTAAKYEIVLQRDYDDGIASSDDATRTSFRNLRQHPEQCPRRDEQLVEQSKSPPDMERDFPLVGNDCR